MISRQRSEVRGQRSDDGRTRLLVWLLFLSFLPSAFCLLPSVLWACPMCKEALFDPGQAAVQSGVVRGYAVSIAAMLGVPALIIGGIGLMIARSARRVKG